MASDPVLLGRPSDAELNDQLLSPLWRPKNRVWLPALAITGLGALFLLAMIAYTVSVGIGLWADLAALLAIGARAWPGGCGDRRGIHSCRSVIRHSNARSPMRVARKSPDE